MDVAEEGVAEEGVTEEGMEWGLGRGLGGIVVHLSKINLHRRPMEDRGE